MRNNPVDILLILGSSKTNGQEIIKKAILEISKYFYIKKQTEIIKTPAYGVEFTNYFYNQAVVIESTIAPHNLLKRLQKIEKNMGQRKKNQLWGDRIIDLDIIFIKDLLYYDSEIIIPHEVYT